MFYWISPKQYSWYKMIYNTKCKILSYRPLMFWFVCFIWTTTSSSHHISYNFIIIICWSFNFCGFICFAVLISFLFDISMAPLARARGVNYNSLQSASVRVLGSTTVYWFNHAIINSWWKRCPGCISYNWAIFC